MSGSSSPSPADRPATSAYEAEDEQDALLPYPTEGSLAVAPADEPVKWTERMLLDRLRLRHGAISGNGPEWAYMEHVADQTGWANRRIDALAMHLWQSRHHEVHAYEVKVSRSDFKRELADPDKAAVWTAWVEHFWIVAPAGMLQPAEVPATWGLLVVRGGGLAIAKRAPRLREKPTGYTPEPDLGRRVVAAMLRSAAKAAGTGPWPGVEPPANDPSQRSGGEK
jgi:hypothetical protein